ncbi:hypothetical protein [Arsenicibacter rosenii]|nr:hypothetical protein [Arsenicibacter rosenii]
MKKMLILGSLLAVLTMSACARKGACPAYGTTQKATQTAQHRA